MKFCWRITKYDPKKRTAQGMFTEDSWTAFSDIGNIYQGKTFTFDEYINIENLYVDAIIDFLNCLNISWLQVKNLEKNKVKKIFL